MDARDLKYPVLGTSKYGLTGFYDANGVTTCYSLEIKSDYYKTLVLVDSDGKTYQVAGAKRIGWVGPYWGFSLMFNRRAKMAVDLNLSEKQLSLAELKGIVLQDFQSDEWQSRGDVDELQQLVTTAASAREVIHHVLRRE